MMKNAKKTLKKVFIIFVAVLVVAFVAIQFSRPSKNVGPEVAAEHMEAVYPIPANVQQILRVSCYDCHSNTTHYPWYSNVQPAAWFLDNHIVEGKKELNFSTFATYPVYRQYKKYKEIGKEVEESTMPMSSYTWLHLGAVLNADQKLLVSNWAAQAMKDMEAKYPAASLVKPK